MLVYIPFVFVDGMCVGRWWQVSRWYVGFLVLTVVFCWNFFFRDGLVVLWRSEDVRFFEGGHTVVCVSSSDR